MGPRAVAFALLVSGIALFVAGSASGRSGAHASAAASCGSGVLGVAQGFNVFVDGQYDATNTSVEGRAAAAGNVTINSYGVGTKLAVDSSRADLIAGGNLSVGGGGAQASNGSVTYGGTLTGSISTPNGTLTKAPPPFSFASEFSSLQSTSTSLGGMTANGTASGPSWSFELVGSDPALNVFSIPASTLQTAQVINIHVPFGSSTLVNVTGGSYTTAAFPTAAVQFWNGSSYVQLPDNPSADLEALRTNLLWNFPDATSVQIGPNLAWQGTVLAPRAAVSFPGSTQLNGTLIAASLAGSMGAARNHPYTGCIGPTPPPEPTVEAVDDNYSVDQGKTLTVAAPGVLGNDSASNGAQLTAALGTTTAHGTLTLQADGSFTYKPSAGFAGTDTFTYTAHAGTAASNVANVTITVAAPAPKIVTFAARSCPSYTDVMANLQRDNLQQSLEDLGPDSRYRSGQPVDPGIESDAQPKCKPLSSWSFTLGTAKGPEVAGSWGSLSTVEGAYATRIVTQATTPLLNDLGQPTGRDLEGAVTVELTPKQADLASGPEGLWLQGGTPTDPVLDGTYPGRYGFAAVRCAVDNLFGDNAEWIAYPDGATHVFCFAYYVDLSAQSGTIVVRKEVAKPVGATETFRFHGNVSYEPDGGFELAVVKGKPAETDFQRQATAAGGKPWSFAEDVPPGWTLDSIACTSKTGASGTTTDLAKASTSVTLAAGDVVTCTYTDSQIPPKGALQITKTTIGGIGTFHYTVTPASASGGKPKTATATTKEPGVEVAASPSSIELASGSYAISETLPADSGDGTWKLDSVDCNGQSYTALPVHVTVAADQGVHCRFVNELIPPGSISIHVVAFGGTGTAGYSIYPQTTPPSPLVYSKTAHVTEQGVPVAATGDPTDAVSLGEYRIQQFAAPGTNVEGWALTSVVCNGDLVGSSQGAVTIHLTAADPDAACTFTNTYSKQPPAPEPEPPPNPDPTPESRIDLTKTADKKTVTVGDIVTYTITAKNVGDAAAQGVTLAEKTPTETAEIVSLQPSQGTCVHTHAPATCYLGTIEPGQTVTIIAKLKATKAGTMPNDVSVNTDSTIVDPPDAGVEGESVTKHPKPKPKPPATTPPPFTG